MNIDLAYVFFINESFLLASRILIWKLFFTSKNKNSMINFHCLIIAIKMGSQKFIARVTIGFKLRNYWYSRTVGLVPQELVKLAAAEFGFICFPLTPYQHWSIVQIIECRNYLPSSNLCEHINIWNWILMFATRH